MRTRAVLLLTVFAVLAAACTGTGDDEGNELPTEIGEGEGSVVIVSWAGYIERGETDPAFDWVTQFEDETGCTVENKVAGTSDEMVALMTGSDEYDLVTASGDSSLRLIAGGSVQEINIDLIESWDTIDPRLQDAEWHTVDGKHYGTPYSSGFNVLGYNTEVFGDTPPDSWNVVFEEQTLPDGESNAGRVQAYDGPIYIADAALYLMSTQPELGIEDPYQLAPGEDGQYETALNLLRQQRDLIGRYWHDAFIQIDDFTNEGVAASSTWPFQTNVLQAGGAPIDKVVPVEGATGWADTTMMSSNAPNPNCAYMWMEWSLNPKLQGDLAAWFGTVPAVPAACEGNELLGPDGCANNGSESFDEIQFWKTPTDDCNGTAEPGSCVPYHEWVTDYLAVIGGRETYVVGSGIGRSPPNHPRMTDTSTRSPTLHRVSTYLNRRPRLRLLLLLGLPVLWLVGVYGGSLLALLLQSFFRLNPFSGVLERVISLDTWETLFTSANTAVMIRTIGMAAAVTVASVVIAFPLAYFMAIYARPKTKAILVLAVLVPLWSSYLVRVYSWKLILAADGIINWFVERLGLQPVLQALLDAPGIGGPSLSISLFGQFVVFVYIWLPFMILPIHASLERVPKSLLEASADLGAQPALTLRKVTWPMAIPGVAAGSIFTFSLTLGDYIIPTIIGDSSPFIGLAIYSYQGVAGNLPLAAAFSFVPIAIMAVYLTVARKLGAFEAL